MTKEIIDVIKSVLGEKLEPIEEQPITPEESSEFRRLDAMLGPHRNEFYALFDESEARKTYLLLRWNLHRFVGDDRIMRLLRNAEYVAMIRQCREMTRALEKFLSGSDTI